MAPQETEGRAPVSAGYGMVGCAGFCGLLLAAILGPFFLFGARLEATASAFLAARPPDWQVAVLISGLLAGDIVLPVPSSLVSTAGGGVLGFWLGAAASWVGMMVSCYVGYELGVRAGEPALVRMAGEAQRARVARMAQRHGHWFLLIFRAVPVLAEISIVFAGVSRMPRRGFLLVCALANLGISVIYAALGAGAAAALLSS
ncbi:MAG: VTT domain-containing protein [Myxococcaceae bacterium]|nr:VTT domain-containing protein [Myxococcaceae bacterium]